MTTEIPVVNPTYMGDIRHFFTAGDKACMRTRGIDLETYQGVKLNALRIYFRTEDGTMPPPGLNRRWSDARVKTFHNWMRNGYPRGVDVPQVQALAKSAPVSRIRRDITSLSAPDIDKLARAFRGIMARPINHPQSYFAVAGVHWLPGPNVYCRHHENAYNPWHRPYLHQFEDALRSVEGCEDVTMPYWDITTKPPAVLYEEPFASYTLPVELRPLEGDPYLRGHVTEREDADTVFAALRRRGVTDNINDALGHSHWERFNGWDAGRTQDGIIKAHDNGHNACGLTMQNQDIAAFDPIFWFFHCNWDRLWWKWQQDWQATDLSSFKTHLGGSANWLDDPTLNRIPPFAESTAETIDLTRTDVGYEHPAREQLVTPSLLEFGSVPAARGFKVKRTRRASVRVKNINRLEIPGSFDVSLLVGGKIIATQGFFQSTNPKQCATCRKKALVSVDFQVDVDVLDDEVSIAIHLLGRAKTASPFPLSTAGDPTVNVRLLLDG